LPRRTGGQLITPALRIEDRKRHRKRATPGIAAGVRQSALIVQQRRHTSLHVGNPEEDDGEGADD
jgi:hypothetical protein